jgi:hypothetical protein
MITYAVAQSEKPNTFYVIKIIDGDHYVMAECWSSIDAQAIVAALS